MPPLVISPPGPRPAPAPTAGRELSSATTHGDPCLRGWLGIATVVIAPTRSRLNYLKSYHHQLCERRGQLRAQVVVQHTFLTATWHMLAHDVACHDLRPDYLDHRPLLQHPTQRARRLIAALIGQGYDSYS